MAIEGMDLVKAAALLGAGLSMGLGAIGPGVGEGMAAAKAWSKWEARTASLLPNGAVVDFFTDPHTALSLARIESHYFVNQAFLQPNQLLQDAHKLSGIPGIIVQGRYDLICPMTSAWELHQAWADSELRVVPDAGHSATEPGIRSALVEATNRFAKELV